MGEMGIHGERITILLADDHELVREGFRKVLERHPDLQVIGEAANGNQVVEMIGRMSPRVLVVDLNMPGINGIEVTRQVTNARRSTRVLLLSAYGEDRYVLQALRSGAAGYVLKGSGSAELVHAIREVAAGRIYLSPPLSLEGLQAFAWEARDESSDPYQRLTPRERLVLQLVAQGLTNAQIGERLNIAPRTADTHRTRLMHKLGLHSDLEVLRYAIRQGLVPLEDEPSDH